MSEEDKIWFNEMFMKYRKSPINYNNEMIYLSDKFPLKSKKQKLKIIFEKTNSQYIQGVSLDTKEGFIVNKEIIKKGIYFREDTIPAKEFEIIAISNDKIMVVFNIWIQKDSLKHEFINSRTNGAAMKVEELPDGKGRRYYCNDGYPDDDFNDLIFRIEYVD